MLAKLGHSVCVVERSVFPRSHIGESLTPGIRPIFEILGLSEPGKNGWSSSDESFIRWSDPRVERVASGRRAGALLVDRAKFDAALLQATMMNGVRVFQPAQIAKVERNDLGWRFEVAANDGSKLFTSKFLVDAAGRKGFLPRKRRAVSPRTLALCGYVSSEECPRATLVEAAPNGWCWGATIPGGLFSSIVFLDQDTVRARRLGGLEFVWRSHLANTALFSPISGLKLVRLAACDATTYFAEDPIGENFIRVGEASLTLDPLSSTGVEKAMQSGLQAAITLHTMLTRADRNELCVRFYWERQKETVTSHASWCGEFYSKVRRYAELPFWRERIRVSPYAPADQDPVDVLVDVSPSLSSRLKLSTEAELVEEACILGDEICSRPALSHPSLIRPVAFVEGVEIAWLLNMVRRGTDLRRLLLHWSTRISLVQSFRVAGWLLKKSILQVEA
jgi:flavin-dependent dehydrogenase